MTHEFPYPFTITPNNGTGKYEVYGPEGDLLDICDSRQEAEDVVRHEMLVIRILGDMA